MSRKIITVLAVLVAAVLIAYVGVSAWQAANPVSVLKKDTDNTRSGVDTSEEEVVMTEEEIKVAEYFDNSNVVNILCLGLDRNEQRLDEYELFRTDAIILVSLDLDAYTVKMISIPRDSWVHLYPSGGQQRVNTTLVFGGGCTEEGYSNCMQTVSNVLGGVPIHYYFSVDMDIVQEVVEIMGGVWVDVEETASPIPSIDEPGYQLLDVQQSLAYVRHRTGDSDIQRGARQRKFLISMAKQLASLGQLKNIPDIYNAIKDDVDTDLTANQIVALAAFATKVDLDNDISQFYADGDYAWAGENSIWALSTQKMHDMLQEAFGIDVWSFGFEDVSVIKSTYDQNPFAKKDEAEEESEAEGGTEGEGTEATETEGTVTEDTTTEVTPTEETPTEETPTEDTPSESETTETGGSDE